VTHPHDNPVRAELQSLDQRRADTLADALRPVALTDDTPTPETWRVVEPDGSVDVLQVQSIGGGVYIIRCDSLGREHVRAASSRCAVDRFAGQYLGAAEIRGPGEATTAEQLAAVLSGVVDIADAVEDEAHEQRARAVERPGRQLIELAHPEGQALAANKIACAVREILSGRDHAAAAYTAPLREQIAARGAEIARLESACDDLQTAWLTASAERDAARDQLAAATRDATETEAELRITQNFAGRHMGVVVAERDEARAERDAALATVRTLNADIAAAAGELLVPIPTPGSDAARLLRANIILRQERDEARAERRAARLDRDAAEERLARYDVSDTARRGGD